MGRRPDYFGGSSIEYMKKGKHYDCRYRSEDGDCMNRASKWFGFMCWEARGKCEEYYQIEQNSSPKSKQKKNNNKSQKHLSENCNNKKVYSANNIKKYEKKPNHVRIGDTIIIRSFTQNKDVRIEVAETRESRSYIAEWALGKALGAKGNYNGNSFQIIQIIKMRQ